MFKGGDEISDVWHALDEATAKVVTLEILRDRANAAARQRFLAEAQRMAAIERPSVMRVAAIHNEATDTFIVFEHLIPLPVVLTGLSAIAKDTKPATKAAEDKTALITPSAPGAPARIVPSPLASVAGPIRSGAAPDLAGDEATAPTIVDLDVSPSSASAAPVPETLRAVSSSLTSARSEVSGFARGVVADVRDIVGLDELVAAARARIPSGLNTALLTSLAGRVTSFAAGLVTLASGLAAPLRSAGSGAPKAPPSSRRASGSARSEAPGAGAVLPAIGAKVGEMLPVALSIATRLGAASRPLIARVRQSPVLSAGAIGILILVAFIASPLDDAIASAFRSAPASPTAVPSGGLSRAPFEVPALAAYGAAFESQGAYPTTTPNGTVEWVVALRNTGSAGWDRGIEGAQAALALPDGTGVAVQSTSYVAPGQVGWFVVHFRARAELGTY